MFEPSCKRNSATSRPRWMSAPIDPSADLREALDIDSMDFLNFITAMHRRLGIDVPEIDFPNYHA